MSEKKYYSEFDGDTQTEAGENQNGEAGVSEIDITNLSKRELKKLMKAQKRKEEEEEPFNLKKEIISWIKIIVAAVVIAYFINNFLIINANVPSGSMEQTIMTHDRMIGNRLAYKFGEVERGDIAIFKFPDDETQIFVKRVIGMPGDKVTISEGKIYINDSTEPLKEDYLPEEWVKSNDGMEFNVPEGSYFVLGDNRNVSNDARFWNNTYVTEEQIIAEAIYVYWPFSHAGVLESADYDQ